MCKVYACVSALHKSCIMYIKIAEMLCMSEKCMPPCSVLSGRTTHYGFCVRWPRPLHGALDGVVASTL